MANNINAFNDCPREMIQSIFSLIPFQKVQQYRRLCRLINDCICDPYFATINLQRAGINCQTSTTMNEDSFDDESECFLPGYLQHSRWMQWRESYQWSYASRCSDTTTHWALYGFESKTTLKIPSAIGIMQHLKDIWLEDIPSLVGDLPSSLGQLSCLEWLVITKTNLSGTLPRALGKCRKLRHLDLSRSRLCGVVPTEWENLEQLEHLDLSDNQIQGYVNPSGWSNLKRLLLSRNQFHGTCGSVARLAKLQQLDLSCNLLSGPLPNGFGNLHELTLLDVSGNQITEELIPAEIFRLTKLKTLRYDESSAMAHSEEQFHVPDVDLMELDK